MLVSDDKGAEVCWTLINMKAIIFIVLVAISAFWLYRAVNGLIKPLPKPEVSNNTYWGPGKPVNYEAPTDIVPFEIKYDQTVCGNDTQIYLSANAII